MADDPVVTLRVLDALENPSGGSGAVAADDVGSALHQYVKVEYGADGTASKVTPTNPLPVGQRTSTIIQQGRKDITAPTPVEIVAANANRSGLTFHIEGNAHIAFGEAATTNHPLYLAYTPFNWLTGLIWTGSVSALSESGTVKANYVEYGA